MALVTRELEARLWKRPVGAARPRPLALNLEDGEALRCVVGERCLVNEERRTLAGMDERLARLGVARVAAMAKPG